MWLRQNDKTIIKFIYNSIIEYTIYVDIHITPRFRLVV